MLNKGLLLGKKIKFYNIIRGSVSNVSLSYSPQTDIKAGTRVNITVNTNDGYQNPWVTVSKNDGTGNVSVSGSGSNRYFTMPNSDVTITAGASVIPTYSVSGSASGGGISFSKTSGIRAGEVITVYLSPNSYYTLSSLTSNPYVSFSGGGNTKTFTMPSSNVTINATFVARYTHIITVAVDDDGSPSGRYEYQNRYGFYRTAGAISPNKFNNYIIDALYSIEGNSYDNEFNQDHYYRREILTVRNSPYSSYTVTRLDTNESQVFPYEDSSDYRDFYDKTFFKSSDAGKNIYLKIVANN